MKKIIYAAMLLLCLGILSSCEKFDDSKIWEKLNEHDNAISQLVENCEKMNTNISSLQTAIKALQEKDYVTSVYPILQGKDTAGYVMNFDKSGTITIHNGKDGRDGEDGEDGYTPVISVELAENGIYYWTLDGEWLLDDAGNKIQANGRDGKDGKDGKDGTDGNDGQDGEDGTDGKDGKDGNDGKDGRDGIDGTDGITPKLKIENDYWYVSYTKGSSWTVVGPATSQSSQISPIKSVTTTDAFVILKLNDNTELKLPRCDKFVASLLGGWKLKDGSNGRYDFLYFATDKLAIDGRIYNVSYYPETHSVYSKNDVSVFILHVSDTQLVLRPGESSHCGEYEKASEGLASAIPDENFKAFCLDSYDSNKDGILTSEETKVVTEIDCSGKGIRSFEGVTYFYNLQSLNISNNPIQSFDEAQEQLLNLRNLNVSNCTLLESLSVCHTQLQSLNVNGCPALTSLVCYNNQLKSLDVSTNTALTNLSCTNNPLTSLDLSNNPNLHSLDCSNCPSLKEIWLKQGFEIPSGNFSQFRYDEGVTIKYKE